MDQQQLNQLSEQLLQEKQRLEDLLERTGKHLYRRDEPYSADFAEQAVEVENNEVVERLDEDAKVDLVKIERALTKITQGNYGLCSECNNEIPPARLEAIPHAEYCIDCIDSGQ